MPNYNYKTAKERRIEEGEKIIRRTLRNINKFPLEPYIKISIALATMLVIYGILTIIYSH